MKTTILLHTIEFSWKDGNKNELDKFDIEHIEEEIKLGNHSGELCQTFTDIDENDKPFDHEIYGWWKIKK